ncbi:hypothetical protein CN03_12130 [Thalassolituus oleivorans]|uniref:hypothetical protein n=1 Tax=Thalassolituus oleivorans TaxID=187493 RepID=UPI00094934F3|nr:hypothetical protein [Thalassolituus oleivorans]APR67611.1 hypothetical protein CN03_12130 [Thalassolituus oleivorans]
MTILKRFFIFALVAGFLFLIIDKLNEKTINIPSFKVASAATPADLPLPSTMPLQDYERVLYNWLMTRQYQLLGWDKDKGVRDTGPFVNAQYYGTHPAVRIHYSPEVITWLQNDRKGDLPDGSIIIKEMFTPPAVLYQDMAANPIYKDGAEYEKFLSSMVFSWTVMVRDKAASKDGWFWANPGAPGLTSACKTSDGKTMLPSSEGAPAGCRKETIAEAVERQLDTLESAPGSGFGAPCLRCHASAKEQLTFSDLKNVEGFFPNEDPLRFLVDTSWRAASHFSSYPLITLSDDPYVKEHFMLPAPLRAYQPDLTNAAVVSALTDKFHAGFNATPVQNSVNDQPLPQPDPTFVATFKSIQPFDKSLVKVFPSQWNDQVVPEAHKTQEYITSDNCMSCHGGLGGQPYGVNMFVKTGPNYGDGYNLSEYGEWRWSPMGLAGRDPIFHSQLESEMALLERDAKQTPTPLKGPLNETKQAVTNTCLSCHGAMGQRQLSIDAATDKTLNPNFSVDYFYLTETLSSEPDKPESTDSPYLEYGQLAREGISCAVCHHIDKPTAEQVDGWTPPPGWINDATHKELAYSLFHNNTGRYERGPADKLFGPFENVAVKPMQNTLGVTPTVNQFVSDSQLCGTCHTINLPNIGATETRFPILNAAETNPAFKDYQHSIEQATFLEWQNSAFAQKPGVEGSQFQSCQDCHMPGGFESIDGSINIDQITTQIAAIQDINYPEADNRLANQDIDIPLRPDYKRHEHVGLNVFLLEMFDQFPEVLGISKTDYMTSANNGVDTAVENMILQAQKRTASIKINVDSVEKNTLKATVKLRNLTGHRFPSGVAFRRAFIEFAVLDGDKEIWVSGSTNNIGVILDGEGKPLESEFLPNADSYQPHYQVINREDQVQIYEELNQNANHEFTTSFIHRVYPIKDNRLLPDGWRASSHFKEDGDLMMEFMQSTDPEHTGDDPDYMDQGPNFKGGDQLVYEVALPKGIDVSRLTVRATLYSQSIPPSWLHQRFSTAPNGMATKRLYYMTSHLNLAGTPMENWKLKLVSDSTRVEK